MDIKMRCMGLGHHLPRTKGYLLCNRIDKITSYLTAIVAVIVNVLVSLRYVLPWSDFNVTLNAPFFPVLT